MQFYVGDTHFFHNRIIEYSNRNFSNVDEMNEAMIENWNAKVGPTDRVYHLGDVIFGGSDKMQIIHRLNGYKILMMGNHDYHHTPTQWKTYFSEVHEIKVIHDEVIGRQVVLLHYPLEEWPHFYKGAVHLHGHCHGHLARTIPGRMDVGIDCHPKFEPFSSEEIRDHFDKIGWPIRG